MIKFEPIPVMIQKIPIPIFAVALAQSALGNLMLLYGWPHGIYWICGIAAACCMLLFLAKLCLYPQMTKDDFMNSPVLAGVSGGAFMAAMQISTYVYSFSHSVAFILWLAAVLGHVILILWFTWRYVIIYHAPAQFYPTYFLVYAGIAVACVTSPMFGMAALGEVVFWPSLFLFVLAFVIVVWRYMTQGPAPVGFKPFFCLFTAPPSLFLASWLVLFPHKTETEIFFILGIAQLFFFMVICYVPRLFKIKFFPSYAALGFPFVISAMACRMAVNALDAMFVTYPAWLDVLAAGEFLFCTIAVVYVTVWYISYIINYCLICHGEQTLS